MTPDHEPNGITKLATWGRYRVPWFVTYWRDGKPDFRVVEAWRWREAVERSLCWICGDPLKRGRYAFPIGPMCTVNRVSGDPAMHLGCAEYSCVHCPFLSDPDRVRREDETTRAAEAAAGDWGAIKRNPGVVAIWLTKKFHLEPGAGTKTLVRLGRPQRVIWYAKGRLATRAEVRESYEAGCPSLEALAREEGVHAVAALREMQAQAIRWWPKA